MKIILLFDFHHPSSLKPLCFRNWCYSHHHMKTATAAKGGIALTLHAIPLMFCNKLLASKSVRNFLTASDWVRNSSCQAVTYTKVSMLWCLYVFVMFISRSWQSFITTMLWHCWTVRYVSLTSELLCHIRLTDKCYVIGNKILTVSFLSFQETLLNVFLVMEVS
jgi:hypothetical protein